MLQRRNRAAWEKRLRRDKLPNHESKSIHALFSMRSSSQTLPSVCTVSLKQHIWSRVHVSSNNNTNTNSNINIKTYNTTAFTRLIYQPDVPAVYQRISYYAKHRENFRDLSKNIAKSNAMFETSRFFAMFENIAKSKRDAKSRYCIRMGYTSQAAGRCGQILSEKCNFFARWRFELFKTIRIAWL